MSAVASQNRFAPPRAEVEDQREPAHDQLLIHDGQQRAP